ncbi:MAG: dihydropteroate synthase, partial [Clostridiales bacterium]|nr:dihydropteroate synthase [Clostridiales bacterium]
MKIGNRDFQTSGHTYVMGILNVTPDSFSDGGRWNRLDQALSHVEEMIQQGADVIDIGGESTRPGYTLLPDQEELGRLQYEVQHLQILQIKK